MYRLRIQGNACSFVSVDVDINGKRKEINYDKKGNHFLPDLRTHSRMGVSKLGRCSNSQRKRKPYLSVVEYVYVVVLKEGKLITERR